jgi:UDP-glucuronate 4-epimerase
MGRFVKLNGMKNKFLITGAAGFIGYHLIQRLIAQGKEVIGLDNFNDYYSPALKRERASRLSEKGASILEQDICDQNALFGLIKDKGITHIIHLAAQAGVRYSLINPHAYVHSNLQGFIPILEACRHFQLPLVFASSSSVYGLNEKMPFSESDMTDNPVSLYGATKKANELMAFSYHHLFKIPMIGLRFFTVYGPWGRPDMAYFSFADAICNERPIQVFNHGKVERDFTYIDDVVDGIMAAIANTAGFEIFNLGNHRPEKVLHLVQILEDCLSKKAKVEFLPLQAGDVEATYADIDKSRKKLGFSPKISLSEGINRFANWFLEYRELCK